MKKLILKYYVGGDIPKYLNGSLFEKVMSNVSNTIRLARDSEFVEGADREIGLNITGNNVGRFVLNRIANNLDPNSTLFGWKMPSGIRTILGSPVTVTLASVPIINPASIGLGTLQYASDKLYRKPNENLAKKQNTKSSNRLGPNGGLSVKKQGGIIKAAAGWRVLNKLLLVQLSPGGSWYYVDLTSDKNGVLYYKVNGSRTWARVTTHDRGYWKTHPELMKITTGENLPTIYDLYFNNANLFTSPSLASSSTAGLQLDTINNIRNTNGTTSTGESSTTGTGTNVGGTNETTTGNTNTGDTTTGSTAVGGTNTEGTTEVIANETTTKKDEKTPVNTYERLVAANTAAFNNGINSAYWRRQYRKNFNRAVANGNLYNKENNTGTYVFDINGMSALNIIDNYWTPGKGLTRKQMHKLRKEYNKPSSDKLESGRLSFYGFNSNKLTV